MCPRDPNGKNSQALPLDQIDVNILTIGDFSGLPMLREGPFYEP